MKDETGSRATPRPERCPSCDDNTVCGDAWHDFDKRDKQDAEILRHAGIIEIAARNDSGSISEYMRHWEGRALKAEAELAALGAQPDADAAEILASERRTSEGPRDPLYFVTLIRAEATSIDGSEDTTQSAANILSYCHQIQESLAVSRSTPAASEPEVQALIERGQKLCEELFDGEVAGSIPENAWETEAVDVISLLIMCVENPPTLRPEAAPAPSLVAGDVLTRPIYEFVRACEHLLTDEQAKASSDNALIAVLCDAVRLTRELQPAVITEAAPDAPLMWAFVVDLFNVVMGDLEWVRAQGGRHSVCPLCHAVCDRDGGPGHLDDCPRMELARRFDALNPNPPVKVVAVAASRSASETTLRKGLVAYINWLWTNDEGADRIVAEKLRELLARSAEKETP